MSSAVLTASSPSPNRRLLSVVALVLAVGLLGWQVVRTADAAALTVPIDYASFWSVGWLTVHGENPYDPARLHEVQKAIGLHHHHAILVYHPPWMLPLLMPLALLPVQAGYGVLCLVQIGLVVAGSDVLWRHYGGSAERRWVGWLVGLGFAPTVILLGAGQLSGFSFAGLALFLAAVRWNRPALAGLAAALIAAKPHLNFLFGVVLLLETTRSGFARRAVLAGVGVGVAMSLVSMAFQPRIWGMHFDGVTAPGSEDHQGLADWRHPLVGSWLRTALPSHPAWVQALPALLATIAVVAYWWRTRPWDWSVELPRLTFVSLLAAVYGAWSFDLVLLLLPVLAVAARMSAGPFTARGGISLAGLLLANVLLYVAVLGKWPQHSYVWATPTVLAATLVLLPTLRFRPVRA